MAEQGQLAKVAEDYGQRRAKSEEEIRRLKSDVACAGAAVEELAGRRSDRETRIRELQQRRAKLESQTAAKQAQIDLLSNEEARAEDYPHGARLVMDEANPLGIDRDSVIGPLADAIQVPADYRRAAEAALRSWLDAILVSDDDHAIAILRQIEGRREGAIRILSASCPTAAVAEPDAAVPGGRLADHVVCDASLIPLFRRILAGVMIVESLDEVPRPVPPHLVYVTKSGSIVRGNGTYEFCMADAGRTNPLTRRHLILDLSQQFDRFDQERQVCEERLRALSSEETDIAGALKEARARLEEVQRRSALKEGESQIVVQEATEAGRRLETVTWELQGLAGQGEAGEEKKRAIADHLEAARNERARLRSEIEAKGRELQEIEKRRADLYTAVTEQKVRFSELRQRAEHLQGQQAPLAQRIQELETVVQNRSQGVDSYGTTIDGLIRSIADAEAQIASLEESVASHAARVQSLKKTREQQAAELSQVDAALAQKRAGLEEAMNAKAGLDVKQAEARMRRQHLVERICADYGMAPEAIAQEPDPEWGEAGRPDAEAIEASIEEIRAKIEAMGPVNLVAIEEYQELEERHDFLTRQQDDLVNAKSQLMDMIRKINQTTAELFTQTFAQINGNFQEMFRTLFNGGSTEWQYLSGGSAAIYGALNQRGRWVKK